MKKFSLVFILCISLWSIWPLFQPGYIPTHDGEFSIVRIWQYAKVLKEGHMPPRWAPDVNSGYGLPLFTFYYPLPYFIGSIIHYLGFTLVDSFKLTLAGGLLTSIVICFFWLQKLFGRTPAIIGTLIFLLTPYLWVEMYVRGSVGEILALTSLMLALVGTEYRKPLVVSFAVAAMILSHNILAMLFFPVLAGYVFLRKREMFSVVVWGLALSTFFWMPALFERRFVLGLSNFDFRDHFTSLAQLIVPAWGTGFSRPGWPADEMSQQIGLGLMGSTLVSIVLIQKEKNEKFRKLIWRALATLTIVLLLTTESSEPLWRSIPALQLVQYPWRFLSFLIPLGALFAAYATRSIKRKWLTLLVVAAALVVSFPYVRPVVYAPRNDEYYLSRKEFTDGTTTVGNSFTTVWTAWEKERPQGRVEIRTGSATVSNISEEATSYTFNIDASSPSRLRLHVSYYPGWRVVLNKEEVEVEEEEGILAFGVEPGKYSVEARFGETPLRQEADIISAGSLFWLVGSAILKQIYARSYRHNTASDRT